MKGDTPGKTRRVLTWIAAAIVGIPLAIFIGLYAFIAMTTTPLHPDAQKVPTLTHLAAANRWGSAVEAARAAVRTAAATQNLPGVSVAVGARGEILWAEGFGWADVEKQSPVSANVRFRIGALSVPLTSAAVGLLLEQNRLSLDDEIELHVPAYPKKAWPVTLRHLMAHTAGVSGTGGDEEPLYSQRCEKTADAFPRFADQPLRAEPGARFRYTPFGWILVSAAIEAAAGEPFFKFMKARVLDPLGMHDTVLDVAAESIPDRVTFYYPRFAGDPRYGHQLVSEGSYGCYAGGGAYLSTPSDLVRFGLAMQGGTLLQPATVQLLQSEQRLSSGESTGYALGWDVETVDSMRAVGHDGDYAMGGTSSLLTFPERGLVVVVTTNTSFADTQAIARAVAQPFLAQMK